MEDKKLQEDYKVLYEKYINLYENVANMLVENRDKNWSPRELLEKWDSFRE